MKEETIVKDILVDLDAMFDTRLPILYAMNKEVTLGLLEKDQYHNRHLDTFSYISSDIFKPFYRNRDKSVLLLSTPTPMVKLVTEYCIEARYLKQSTNNTTPLTLYVNIHPYKLNIMEQHNLMAMIETRVKVDYVKIVSFSNSELVPKWVNSNLSTLIKYDGLDWLELHVSNSNIYRSPVLDINLITPAILPGNISSKDVNGDLFRNIMSTYGSIITLSMINTKYFCTVK